MRKLTPADVLPLDEYLRARESLRRSVRAARAVRRVSIGDRISVLFENRETVLFQIHEMLRVENLRDPERVVDEVRVYNDLLGGPNELRATFFVEITDRGRIQADLDSLVGLETRGLTLGVGADIVPAEFEPGHAREDRISAVHYVGFRLTPAQRAALSVPGADVRLAVEHPNYAATTSLSEATRAALAEDLASHN